MTEEDYSWILRSERAKTRKPKGQYLYDEFKDRDYGVINFPETVEYDWRKEHETPFETSKEYDPDPEKIDFSGPKGEEVLNNE